MITKKEKSLHIYSLFTLALVLTVFFLLGGGQAAEAGLASDPADFNLSIPNASVDELASSRFMAEKREEQKKHDSRRKENLQKNSFEFFHSNKKNSTSYSPKTSSTPGVESTSKSPVFSYDKNTGSDEDRVVIAKEKKHAETKRIMKRKREQLEKELGITLDDYVKEESEPVTALNTEVEPQEESGFYGLDETEEQFAGDIRAVIHGDHIDKRSGSIIKMRILDEVELGGVTVPQNTFVYGKLTFKNGRGMIQIQNINYRNRILKFPATIYDTDGFEGIYIPENIVSNTTNKAAADAIGAVNIDVSSKSRLASSTVSAMGNAIKSAVQGSVKESKISISSDYHITIKKKK